ncbi:hypothetical protein [Marinomonas epiphytica]
MAINGVGNDAMAYANEVYSASLAKSAQEQQAQQALALLESAAQSPVSTPAAVSGSHTTTDVLGQNINIRV